MYADYHINPGPKSLDNSFSPIKLMLMVNSVYPNFLFIGPSKTGSSWIYAILCEHPEIFVPLAKDVQFFDHNYTKGLEWYLSFFTLGVGKKAVGEVAHDYFWVEESAERIRRLVPKVRLLCCLREPVERTISSFLFDRNLFLNKKKTFESYISSRERVLKPNDYYNNLSRFYAMFPRENILVLFFDDLQKDSARFAAKIYEFLGVDPSFQPSVLYKKVLPAKEPKLYWLGHLGFRVGLGLRKLGLANVVGAIKGNETFWKLFYKKLQDKPDMPEVVVRKLKVYYRESCKHLPDLIGQSLPEGWFE